ncbi:hypothetical protein FDP41_013110 [Naegleria fowleri]|uniref:G domain-containing protein n=1 Tax=Naegleria fowleri TaxID=5763 RepID=A0A6A5BTV0_NAEFO|nr:uncharacterized protein FDP41_013110 [Naegleria fowleri]KAF0980627.1 hypothetical protein FDP41_013110 [Naegleria fowleri]CAG4719451.1 unnamed protein product [Naegleria fowleri]
MSSSSSSQNAILVLGTTGVGKSSLCSYLTNSNHFAISEATSSCTAKCDHFFSTELGVHVVDTPGLRDTRQTNPPSGSTMRFDRNSLTAEILSYCKQHSFNIRLVILLIDVLPRCRLDEDVNFLITTITGLASETDSRILMACSNRETPSRVTRMYPAYPCVQLDWNDTIGGYTFDKTI